MSLHIKTPAKAKQFCTDVCQKLSEEEPACTADLLSAQRQGLWQSAVSLPPLTHPLSRASLLQWKLLAPE